MIFILEWEEGPVEEDDCDDPFFDEAKVQAQMARGAMMKREVYPEEEFQQTKDQDRMVGWGGQYSPKRNVISEIAAKGNDL